MEEITIKVTPEQKSKILRIINPSRQSRYYHRKKLYAPPQSGTPSPPPTTPTFRSRKSVKIFTPSHYVEFANINGKRCVQKLDCTREQLTAALEVNKKLKPQVLVRDLDEQAAALWFLENKPTLDDSNSWRF